ncbi:MAG: hypothetical protein JNL76_01590 [Alphaproteobacteria bacterium]|nr:hypothetical protein [Alphaproteobacteria bacterium]
MLKVLGSKRLMFICCMVGGLGLLAYAYYNFIVPAHEKSTQELATSKSAVREKYQEVARLKEEYVLLQSQLRAYKELEARGFFNDQERASAVDKLDKLSKYAGLLKANLKFGSGKLVQDSGAEAAGQVIVKSPVSIEAKSIDDVDVYSFMKFVEEKFPGRIDIVTFSLSRMEIFDATILRKIGSGEPTALVDAKISFDWLTMAPKDVVAPLEGGQK